MKSKDVLEIFKSLGVEKKSGGSADDVEFARFFQKVTRENQIENIDEYLDGKATIRVPHTEKKTAVKETPAAPKAEAKEQEPTRQTPKAEPVPKAEPAPKAEPTPAPEVPAQAKAPEQKK